MIFNIQRFSLHDGDGIRTLIFFKGCPLACAWCSNPESQSFQPEFLLDREKCIGCRDCAAAAVGGEVDWDNGPRLDRDRPFAPELFRRLCPAEALTVAGEERDVDAIVREALKDRLFYRNGGGITLSGGEPFAQPDFARRLLAAAKDAGLATGVETCLAVGWPAIEPCLPHLDFVYADVKHVDPDKYRAATGGDPSVAHDNLRRLARSGTPWSARIPVIPGFNSDGDELDAIAAFVASLGSAKALHLIPFHPFGEGKYRLLDREYAFSGVPATLPEDLAAAAQRLARHGLTVHIGG